MGEGEVLEKANAKNVKGHVMVIILGKAIVRATGFSFDRRRGIQI